MKITAIEIQKKNEKRCSVFIDDNFAFGMFIDDCAILKLKVGKELTESEYDYITKYIVFEDAKNTANKYLSYRARTTYEVRKKLQDKDFTEEIINDVIDILISYNYLDDVKYTETFITESINFKNRGHIRIAMELKQKGIPKEIIDNAFLELDTKESEITKAYELLCLKIKTNKPDFKEKNRVLNLLLRRGFSFDDAKSAFSIFEDENNIDNINYDDY